MIIGEWGVVDCEFVFFFFKQKTAYEIRNCDWSSDVCSSDLRCWRKERGVGGRTEALEEGERRWRKKRGIGRGTDRKSVV